MTAWWCTLGTTGVIVDLPDHIVWPRCCGLSDSMSSATLERLTLCAHDPRWHAARQAARIFTKALRCQPVTPEQVTVSPALARHTSAAARWFADPPARKSRRRSPGATSPTSSNDPAGTNPGTGPASPGPSLEI